MNEGESVKTWLYKLNLEYSTAMFEMIRLRSEIDTSKSLMKRQESELTIKALQEDGLTNETKRKAAIQKALDSDELYGKYKSQHIELSKSLYENENKAEVYRFQQRGYVSIGKLITAENGLKLSLMG